MSLRSQRLNNPKERSLRLALLHAPHVAPLTEFVQLLRRETGLRQEIPFFDPLDGGVTARCLSGSERGAERLHIEGQSGADSQKHAAGS